jgi:hypothetical protein
MSETEPWSLACGHCEKTLPEQTRQYVSPTCDVCRFHVHEECLDECLEKLAWPPDHAGDQGWTFACGHCGEALPPQVPGKESPTCANCHYHIHLRCSLDVLYPHAAHLVQQALVRPLRRDPAHVRLQATAEG